MQEGLSAFLKQVGSLIRVLSLYDSQKDSICASSILTLKSSINTVLSNELNISWKWAEKPFHNVSKCLEILDLLRS